MGTLLVIFIVVPAVLAVLLPSFMDYGKRKSICKILVVGLVLACSSLYAERYRVESQYPDLAPGDGFMEQGTYSNPYVVKSGYQTVGTIRPQFMPIGDSALSRPGSSSNPWVLDTNDRY